MKKLTLKRKLHHASQARRSAARRTVRLERERVAGLATRHENQIGAARNRLRVWRRTHPVADAASRGWYSAIWQNLNGRL